MNAFFRTIFASAVAAGCIATPSLGEPVEGIWRTEPDAQGQVALVSASSCGEKLCGSIVAVENSDGQKIAHPNVGVRLFWDMAETSGGLYQGRAYVPAHQRDYAATMQVSGSQMKVRGCFGPVCQSQTWVRTR